MCCALITLQTVRIEAQEITYKNAPKFLPRTTEAMHHPGFWISKCKGDPDRVVLTPEQIVELNRKKMNFFNHLK